MHMWIRGDYRDCTKSGRGQREGTGQKGLLNLGLKQERSGEVELCKRGTYQQLRTTPGYQLTCIEIDNFG